MLGKCQRESRTLGIVWRVPRDWRTRGRQVIVSYRVDLQSTIYSVLMPPWGWALRGQPVWSDSSAALPTKGKDSYLCPLTWPNLFSLPLCSHSSESCFCFMDFFFFFLIIIIFQCYLSASAVGRGKDQMWTRLKIREAEGQKREGEEGSKTIFVGSQPLLLLTFLNKGGSMYFTAIYFKSSKSELKWKKI